MPERIVRLAHRVGGLHNNLVLGVILGLAALVVFASFLGAGLAFNQRFSQTDQRRKVQANINLLVAQGVYTNCQEIEKLKSLSRQEAIDNYKDLNRNLKLLHLSRTPDIVQAAKEARDKRLARFKRSPCPAPKKVKRIATTRG